ncbi:Rne/Rng family ribonuclease [Aquibium microcysteis]|uniref:Rne/Rng family ribonuclease n=1 Tax=Aquibium microcysteis TaxID=675281 RepID=UPI00165CFBBE|nr:ribonuclease E/G [Aquibium microcysteis]
MPNKMLIDASHPEETRVVVTRGNRIEEFDFESQDKKQLKGNIYLARVTRVEPSLQAAFVEYGGNRHGFLAFSEIHPDYYQIPVADRQALLRAEAEAAEEEDEDEDPEERSERGKQKRRRNGRGRGRNRRDDEAAASGDAAEAGSEPEPEADEGVESVGSFENGDPESESDEISAEDRQDAPSDEDDGGADDGGRGGPAMAAAISADVVSEDADGHAERSRDFGSDDGDDNGGPRSIEEADEEVESVGAEDAMEELPNRRKVFRKQYKIQEVIKRRQILLVQVVKEERGNKGAALTTYLSLAGRYSVLMPNTARGGGISRKITSLQDRKRLKDVVKELEVPQGMGVILRTAGANRTKPEIKRDYEYLMRLWENVRTLTLQSTAPALVYEEGSLIKRSVRDLYNKDIDEILVAGDDGYREAKDFMRMLMPSHAKVVQPYRDVVPIFARNGIEAQLDRMLQPQVTLKSGGYIIINQTEALVSIDVNSGRSTREHSIEDTALQTNLEAAEEVARQLRLRDLAGLIVIDFIDMEEKRNNRAVEKKMKDCLKNDRARIQVGRISHFGLLEMSRQRIRASVLESTMKPCPHCGGTGHVRSDSSVALHVVRAIEEHLLKDNRHHITVRTPVATALYVLNHKRANIIDLETRFGLSITIEADESVGIQHYAIMRGAVVENPVAIPAMPSYADTAEDEILDAAIVPEVEDEEEEVVAAQPERREPREQREPRESTSEDGQGRRKRKRRRRRGGRDRDGQETGTQVAADAATNADTDEPEQDGSESEAVEMADEPGTDADGGKKRRRGKRGGRKNRRDADGSEIEAGAEGSDDDGDDVQAAEAPAEAPAVETAEAPVVVTAEVPVAEPIATEAAAEPVAEPAPESEDKPAPKKRARRPSKKALAEAEAAARAAEEAAQASAAAAAETEAAPAAETPAEPAAAPMTSAEAPVAAPEPAVADDAAEPSRASRRKPSAPLATEPVVTSTATPAEGEEKPRKAGWWQRKSFF